MKTISLLLITICLSCCQNDRTTKEIKEKAGRIRMELLNNKSLVSNFLKPSGVSVTSTNSDRTDFIYNTTRKENSLVESILMVGTVFPDSSENITFDERHYKKDKEVKSYVYTVNKYGVIPWAYY